MIEKLADELAKTNVMADYEKMFGKPWKVRKDGYGVMVFKKTYKLSQHIDPNKVVDGRFWRVAISLPNDHTLIGSSDSEAVSMLFPKVQCIDGNVVGWDYLFKDPAPRTIMKHIADEIRHLKQHDCEVKGEEYNE